jgi:hypothetical protein
MTPNDRIRMMFATFDAKDVSRDGLVSEYRSYMDATPVYS